MNYLDRQIWQRRAFAFLVLAVLAGCKGGGTPNRPDAGSNTDTSVDRPVDAGDTAGGGDGGGGVCPPNPTATLTNGEACACNPQCSSGFCVDGFCCDTACNGTCQSCGLPTSLGTCTSTPAGVKPRTASQCVAEDKTTCGLDGTCDGKGGCRKHEEGTMCKAGTCDSDAIVGAYTCDGAGRCKLGETKICAPYSCNRSTNACLATCSSDADCVAGRKCVQGMCGKKPNGAECGTGEECASTFCADVVNGKGVCCNIACDGACRSCSLVATAGTCTPIPAGQGHPKCTKEVSTTCGSTGVCDGFGACSQYPSGTPCGAATCLTVNSANAPRACDGLGTCQAPDVQYCGGFRCVNGVCNSKCTTNAECNDGVACVNGRCGPLVDGQPCTENTQCQNLNCVKDTPTSPGVCCNTACTGGCRSCALAASRGRCTLVAAGSADPRLTCTDMTAATCGTDGRCDGAGACRRYAAGTVCAGETCANDVYAGPSTCNASGQCIKPANQPCFPYHCNANRCFNACTTNAQCIAPNICGMNGMISSCGLKPNGATCSAGNECSSSFCAQGVCCNAACTAACKACNLAGSVGVCSNINSGGDGRCASTAANSCGTTGQCAGGACAFHPSGTQCLPAACPTASTRRPPSACNGTGTCVTPANTNCAPGRCDTTTLNCTNSCTTATTTPPQCTSPAMCVNGSCGLLPNGGSCTTNNQCMSGQCYLFEGSPGVCCNNACNGTCESCRRSGSVGTCTAIPAGVADPDPMTMCTATATTTCGRNGLCAGNNTASNGGGTERCQNYPATQGCRTQSCAAGSATAPATLTMPVNCNGTGTCPAATTTPCTGYRNCNGTSCATSCTTDAECVAPVTCVLNKCGTKGGLGAACMVAGDCASTFCARPAGSTGMGVCCSSACDGTCQSCTVSGSVGTCSSVPSMCGDGNMCNGTETCTNGNCAAGTAVTCTALDACHVAGTCNPTTGVCTNPNAPMGTSCSDNNACTTGETCNAMGMCAGGTPKMCGAATACRAAETCNTANGNCVAGTPVANGTACNDANMCTQTDTCQGGTCTGSNPVSCPAPDQCHNTRICDSMTGMCSNPAKTNGTACDADDDACTVGDTCQSGTCTPGPAKTCPAPAVCHTQGTCDPGTGNCSTPNAMNGTSCSDGNMCTQTDSCQSGSCVGTNSIVCTALDDCHDAGTCNPSNGTCSNPNSPITKSCNDGNSCTTPDHCDGSGMCTGTPMTCDMGEVCMSGMCMLQP